MILSGPKQVTIFCCLAAAYFRFNEQQVWKNKKKKHFVSFGNDFFVTES